MESDIRRPCARCRAIGPCDCARFAEAEQQPLGIRPYAPAVSSLPAPYGRDDPFPGPGPGVTDLGLFAPQRPGTDLVRYEAPSTEIEPYRPGRRGAHRAPSGRRRLLTTLGALVATAATAGVVALGVKAFDDSERATEVLPDPSQSAPDLAPDDDPSGKPSKEDERGSPSPSGSDKPSPGASKASPSSSSGAPADSAEPGTSAPGGAPEATTPAPPSSQAPTTSAPAPPPPPPTLRQGDEGAEVTELQQRLAQLGLYSGAPDGDFDRDTRDAVRRYQDARGTRSDGYGVYGPATRAALEGETSEP